MNANFAFNVPRRQYKCIMEYFGACLYHVYKTLTVPYVPIEIKSVSMISKNLHQSFHRSKNRSDKMQAYH